MRLLQQDHPSTEKGLTLVEVLISISLTTLTFVGIFATYTTSLAIQGDIDDRAKVLFMVQRTLEEALTVNYEDLDESTTIEFVEGQVDGYLLFTNTIEEVQDEGMHDLWIRLNDPHPDVQMKRITVEATWGPYSIEPADWEKLKLSALRVERENTVDFSERASSQLPWN